ncbi:putative RiPP precursor [Mesorhizobium sp. Mes31]
MKKTYEKPTLDKRQQLTRVTALTVLSGSE